MSQYKIGSVAVTNGSPAVVGTGTAFLANARIGATFTIVGSTVPYVIGNVIDDTHLTLTSNYAGSTATGQTYVIQTSFTPNLSIPYMEQGDIETATIFKRAMLQIDPLLTTSANSTSASATAAAASATNAAVSASSASTSATNAAASAQAAQAAQSAVQAAGLNPPILMGPNAVTTNTTIPADYNAHSIGPLQIADGVTVTISDNSTWSII